MKRRMGCLANACLLWADIRIRLWADIRIRPAAQLKGQPPQRPERPADACRATLLLPRRADTYHEKLIQTAQRAPASCHEGHGGEEGVGECSGGATASLQQPGAIAHLAAQQARMHMQQAEVNAASPRLQAVAHLVRQGVGGAGGLCTAQAAQGCRQVQVSGGVSTRQTGRQAWQPQGSSKGSTMRPSGYRCTRLHYRSHCLAPMMVPENASTTEARKAQSTGRLRSRVMGVPEAPSADDPGLHKNIAAQWHLVGPAKGDLLA